MIFRSLVLLLLGFIAGALVVRSTRLTTPTPAIVQADVEFLAGPATTAPADAPVLRIYDIDDLIEMYMAHRRRWATTQPVDTGLFGGWYSEPTVDEAVEYVISMIQDLVDSDEWKDNGGTIGSIREYAGRLIIVHTPRAHAKIGVLLDQLRRRELQVGPTTRPSP